MLLPSLGGPVAPARTHTSLASELRQPPGAARMNARIERAASAQPSSGVLGVLARSGSHGTMQQASPLVVNESDTLALLCAYRVTRPLCLPSYSVEAHVIWAMNSQVCWLTPHLPRSHAPDFPFSTRRPISSFLVHRMHLANMQPCFPSTPQVPLLAYTQFASLTYCKPGAPPRGEGGKIPPPPKNCFRKMVLFSRAV